MSDFVIDQVSWHLRTPGNTESPESIRTRFWAVTRFLQEKGLTARPLIGSPDEITESFCIRSSDLTDEGLELLKKAYDKWLRAVDRGKDPDDTTVLEKELAKLRRLK